MKRKIRWDYHHTNIQELIRRVTTCRWRINEDSENFYDFKINDKKIKV